MWSSERELARFQSKSWKSCFEWHQNFSKNNFFHAAIIKYAVALPHKISIESKQCSSWHDAMKTSVIQNNLLGKHACFTLNFNILNMWSDDTTGGSATLAPLRCASCALLYITHEKASNHRTSWFFSVMLFKDAHSSGQNAKARWSEWEKTMEKMSVHKFWQSNDFDWSNWTEACRIHHFVTMCQKW